MRTVPGQVRATILCRRGGLIVHHMDGDIDRVACDRLIMFLFNAVWTTLFSTAYLLWIMDGAIHFLASVASSVIWLLLTSVLWVCTHVLPHLPLYVAVIF